MGVGVLDVETLGAAAAGQQQAEERDQRDGTTPRGQRHAGEGSKEMLECRECRECRNVGMPQAAIGQSVSGNDDEVP